MPRKAAPVPSERPDAVARRLINAGQGLGAPAPLAREAARSSAAPGNGDAPAAPPADAAQIAALRDRLRTAIAAISEERKSATKH